ncbi:MAG: CHAD domain-containing protein [Acidobacteria bacterium]|nr:CHAD domain-containing protein [Acidobacteriota bacterium]
MNDQDSPKLSALTGRDVVTHFLRREVKSITRYGPLVQEGFDSEGVHQLRVSARRMRSELQAMRDVLPREPWRDLGEDLKWMGATLGRLRDLDVLAELFDDHLTGATGLRDTVMSTLERRRASPQRDVEELLASSRYRRIVRRLRRLRRHPAMGDAGHTAAAELFFPSLWGAVGTYFATIGDPYDHRDDESLHRVRIASKKCRYNFEVAALYAGEEARVVAASLEAIQSILGQVHDRSVAVGFLDSLALGSDADLEVRHALRAEIVELRPQWITHFHDVQRVAPVVFARR